MSPVFLSGGKSLNAYKLGGIFFLVERTLSQLLQSTRDISSASLLLVSACHTLLFANFARWSWWPLLRDSECFVSSTDDHFLLVLALSVVLCLTCLCLLVRAYGTKNRYRGKEKEIQRPFLKGSRGPRSPRSAVLLGNLVGFRNVMFKILWCDVKLKLSKRWM